MYTEYLNNLRSIANNESINNELWEKNNLTSKNNKEICLKGVLNIKKR